MKYGKCHFDLKTGQVVDDDGSLEWLEGSLEEAKSHVEEDDNYCVLFFPKDVPGLGSPLRKCVSRSEFEKHPGIYGVCYYHGWSGFIFE